MDLILENAEHFFIQITPVMERYDQEELLDYKYFEDKKRELKLLLEGTRTVNCNATPYGRNRRPAKVCEDEKENFLVPVPRGKVHAATQSSSETSNKSRRTTRKGSSTYKESKSTFKCGLSIHRKPSIEPRRETRSRASKRSTSTYSEIIVEKRKTRNQIVNTSDTLIEEVNVRRVTRSQMINPPECVPTSSNLKVQEAVEIGKKNILMETKGNTAQNMNVASTPPSQPLLRNFTPNSVKQLVKNYEELISVGESGGENKTNTDCLLLASTFKKDNMTGILSSTANKMKTKLDSPFLKKDLKGLTILKESAVQEFKAALEEEEENQDDEPCVSACVVVENTGATKKQSDEECMNPDRNVKANDDWVTEDENGNKKNKPIKGKQNLLLNAAKSVPLKTEIANGSCKALRSRKRLNASKSGLSLARQPQKLDSDKKEAGVKTLKRKVGKEVNLGKELNLVKKREEMMKKKTVEIKKKQERKIANVKRTQQLLEKGEPPKLKKGKVEKKKQTTVEEVKIIPSPASKVNTPKLYLDATFVKNKDQKEGMASGTNSQCLPVAPPAQNYNPNDYGIVEKSDCSSEDEEVPNKKIPAWAQIHRNSSKLFIQELLPRKFISEFWYSKPSTPTIKEFFGTNVSKKTLKQGLDHRTSSACWNMPPIKK